MRSYELTSQRSRIPTTRCESTPTSSSKSTKEALLARSESLSTIRSRSCKLRHWTWWPSTSWFSPKLNAKSTASSILTNSARCAYSSEHSIAWSIMRSRVMWMRIIGLIWSIWTCRAVLEWRYWHAFRQTGWNLSVKPSKVGGCVSMPPKWSKDSRKPSKANLPRNSLKVCNSSKSCRPSRTI